MPSSVRRSQELQKKLQRRNNSLKPADFTKDHTVVSHVETKKDPVEKSKAALSDLRKRIDERKNVSKFIDVQQYQERREEHIPELTGVTFSESPISDRQEASPKEETPAQTIVRLLEKVPSRNLKNHYKDQDRYRKDFSEEENLTNFNKAPPSQIDIRAMYTPDNDDDITEVSEITTDVRIMSTRGASYAEHRMAGNVQIKLARPSLSTPTGHHLERDVNINVNNLRHLGKAVEQAKMDLRKEMSPTNDTPRRYGLPYDATDYRASVDEDEADSWGDAIRTDFQKQRDTMDYPTLKEEHNMQFIVDKNAAKKLQKLAKEAYSYEGDIFIDATDIREEDLDGEGPILSDGCNHATPIKVDDSTVGTSVLLGGEILRFEMEEKANSSECCEEINKFAKMSREKANKVSSSPKGTENDLTDASFKEGANRNQKSDGIECENIESGDQTLENLENQSTGFTNNPASMASDFYNSSLDYFKSFSNKAGNQLKSFQRQGLISQRDMDGMLGVLEHDVEKTKTELPKDGNDVVIFIGDEFEVSACGTNMQAVEENLKKNTGSNPDPVEKMLESLKKSYNTGISKCGIDSDLIKENTKAIEEMVANLKNAKRSSSDGDQNDSSGVAASRAHTESLSEIEFDRKLLKELSAEGVEDMFQEPIQLTGTKGGNKTFIVSVNMPKNE